jgi:hypothetical protein
MTPKQSAKFAALSAAVDALGKTISQTSKPVNRTGQCGFALDGTEIYALVTSKDGRNSGYIVISAGGAIDLPFVRSFSGGYFDAATRADELEKGRTPDGFAFGRKGSAKHQESNNDLIAITTDDLVKASAEYEHHIGVIPYQLALGLLRAGHELEACVLFLAVLNFRMFQRARDPDIDSLRKVLHKLQGDFAELAKYSIQTIDLTKHRDRIAGIYEKLKLITGVGDTGAAKLMHLKLPELFVMWDSYIRGEHRREDYDALLCVAARMWSFRKYKKTGSDYVRFLFNVQSCIRDLSYPTAPRTLAKIIDEWHYINITSPISAVEQARKTQRSRNKSVER